MGLFSLILDMLQIALDYLTADAEIAPDEVSEATIERGFGDIWSVEMVSEIGRCVAFLSDTGHVGTYDVYHLHWYDYCAVCGSPALQSCSGCHGFFCGTHYQEHMQDNKAYLNG